MNGIGVRVALGSNKFSGTPRETKEKFVELTVDLEGFSVILMGEPTLCQYLAKRLAASAAPPPRSPPLAPADAPPLAVTAVPMPRTVIKMERASRDATEEPEAIPRLLVSALVIVTENNAAQRATPSALISSDDDPKTVRQAVQAVVRGMYFVSSRTGRS